MAQLYEICIKGLLFHFKTVYDIPLGAMIADSHSSDEEMLGVHPDDVACDLEITDLFLLNEDTCPVLVFGQIQQDMTAAEVYESALDKLATLLPRDYSYQEYSPHKTAAVVSGAIDYIIFLEDQRRQIFTNQLHEYSLLEETSFRDNGLEENTSPDTVQEKEDKSLKCEGPKRPKNGFIRFSMEHRKWLSRDHPRLDNREISRMLGAKWRKMTFEERKPYEEEFETDMKSIREKYPNWRYAPVKKGIQDLIEPMPTRLRDRRCLKRKIPPVVEILGKKKPRSTKKRVSQSGGSLWVKCALCRKWRKLSSSADQASLPEQWYCALNPDFRFNNCDTPQQSWVPNSPDADDFLSMI